MGTRTIWGGVRKKNSGDLSFGGAAYNFYIIRGSRCEKEASFKKSTITIIAIEMIDAGYLKNESERRNESLKESVKKNPNKIWRGGGKAIYC